MVYQPVRERSNAPFSHFKQRWHKYILYAYILIFPSACVPTALSQPQLEETSIQFSWTHNVSWASFYLADAEGYYRENGLMVDLRPISFDEQDQPLDPLMQVVSGKADFGAIDATRLLKARSEGLPIVAIATIYQRHPLAFVSLADKGIVRLTDLPDTNVSISASSKIIFQTLLDNEGIDAQTINILDRADYSAQPLIDGTVDVIDGWVTSDIVALSLADHDVNMIFPADYGLERYANVIYTTETMILNRPDLVEQFLGATIQGMEDTVANPTKAAEIILQYNEDWDIEFTQAATIRSLPLLEPLGNRPAMMETKVWEMMAASLIDQEVVEAEFQVAEAYTLDFLQQIYDSAQ
ncbi:MAG: ABC transporter substrate-binding protein [Chloroflexota bacterium]